MTRILPRACGATALVLAALLVTACSTPQAPAAEPTPSTTPTAAEPVAEPTTDADPDDAADAEPTCETIVTAETVAAFEEVGWTAQADVFRIGALEVPDGVMCKWGNHEVASDQVQQFGWAPIDAATADTAQQSLVAEGWRTEQAADGVIVTESEGTVIAPDAEGYGWTYLFGDGWVRFADTKQSLLLIEWPKA